MSNTVTLSAYSIKVYPKGNTEEELQLSDFSNGNDLFDFLIKYLSNLKPSSEETIDLIKDEVLKKVLRVASESLSPSGRSFTGLVEKGEFGTKTKIIDIDTGVKTHDKEINESELLPFFFHLFIPDTGTDGILMVQRFRQHGMYGIFSKIIKAGFKKEFADFTLKIEPLVSKEVVENLMNNGDLKRITFKSLSLSRELVDLADVNGMNPNVGRIEYSIVANSRQKLPFMKRVLKAFSSGEQELETLLGSYNFDYNNVKVNVKLNGNSRTLDLSTLENIGAYFDITQEVEIDKDTKFPKLGSLRQITSGYVNDLYLTIQDAQKENQ